MMDGDTCILITTFLRDNALFECIKSIREFYPDIAIFVADTGREGDVKDGLCSEYNCTLIRVPFDSGVCRVRNEAFGHIPDSFKYVFICEDDIIFTENTKIEILKVILEKRQQIGIAGGSITKVKKYKTEKQDYNATLRIDNGTIYLEEVTKPEWGIIDGFRYFYCDIISNVFLMRRDVWDEMKWDEQYKTTPEHTDFFLSLKQNTNWQVIFVDSVKMEHHDQEYKDHEYIIKRTRVDGYRRLALKWNVKYYWNSWNRKWGIDNPMGLYTYARLRYPRQAEESILPKKKRKSEVAIGIKTFMREETLFRVLDSIEKYFPFSYKLYIADDGDISEEKEYRYQQLEAQGHVITRLPFNAGLSAGRNEIIRRVTEDYILITDDDIMLNDSESISRMKEILDSEPDIGLCAGMIYQEGGEPFGGKEYSQGLMLEIDNNVLYRYKSNGNLSKLNGMIFNYADQVVNFFLAKREVFDDVRWDDRIKIEYEHMDFFLELKKTGWKAAVCLNTKLTHCHSLKIDPAYVRHRRSAPMQYFYAKHGIGNIINRYLQQ